MADAAVDTTALPARPAVLVMSYKQLQNMICQAEGCGQVVNSDDFALEIGTGLAYHYACYVKQKNRQQGVAAAPGNEKKTKKPAHALEEYLKHSRFVPVHANDKPEHATLCKALANQWRVLRTGSLTPSDLQIRFTPWSRAWDATLGENVSWWWSKEAARHMVWPDGGSLNRSRGTTFIQHLFPVDWFTEGAMHFVCRVKPSRASAEAACKLAPQMNDVLRKTWEEKQHVLVTASTWTNKAVGTSYTLRVQWQAVKGSALFYRPAHTLADGPLDRQALAWQKEWQAVVLDPLEQAVRSALQVVTELLPELQITTPWAPSGAVQLRAQFTTDTKTGDVAAWAGIVPQRPIVREHYIVTQTDKLFLLRYATHDPEDDLVWLPYRLPSASAVDLALEYAPDITEAACSELIPVDSDKLLRT